MGRCQSCCCCLPSLILPLMPPLHLQIQMDRPMYSVPVEVISSSHVLFQKACKVQWRAVAEADAAQAADSATSEVAKGNMVARLQATDFDLLHWQHRAADPEVKAQALTLEAIKVGCYAHCWLPHL